MLLVDHLLEFVFVLLSEDASPFLPLGDEVVRRGQVVELVSANVILALLQVNLVVALQQLHDLGVDWNFVLADDDALLLIGSNLVVPRVFADVLDGVALGRVRIQYQRYQAFHFVAQETRQLVVGLQYFLV